ncbi:CatB-related O-acetyltransferase [Rhodocytophaga rosea]|uniref:CatB-related O-acetyltransferase n=1 Tax=Rhodocytophaga rosea TaxID=2704465 RepID=A0A6C0GLH4_9BACT|nr:CatB-related O-acetyltransferase [Rhodocytophaga rosea]QHT68839.1 CatB-related O-acetyltransferase [Rhodocytophaga rosea]
MWEYIIKNPVSLWIQWIVATAVLKYKHRHKKLNIRNGAIIKKTHIGYCTKFYEYAYVYNCTIGDFSYVGRNSRVGNCVIGKFCSIGPEFKCGLGKHPSHTFVSSSPIFYSTGQQLPLSFVSADYFEEFAQVSVGNDVWIGTSVIIMDGVTVGDGAIIASGAVVTKDIPPYSIVGGVPARHIRYRFGPEEIEFLLKFKWWDKDPQWLQTHAAEFRNISEFIAKNPSSL